MHNVQDPFWECQQEWHETLEEAWSLSGWHWLHVTARNNSRQKLRPLLSGAFDRTLQLQDLDSELSLRASSECRIKCETTYFLSKSFRSLSPSPLSKDSLYQWPLLKFCTKSTFKHLASSLVLSQVLAVNQQRKGMTWDIWQTENFPR